MPPTPPLLDEDAVLTLANLVHMMLADGNIDDRETSLVHDVARRLGLGEAPSIDELLDIGLSTGGTFSSPRGPQICLAECLRIANIDGTVHPAEVRAWKQLAISFGYSSETTDAAMRAGCEALRSGADPFDSIRNAIEQQKPRTT